MLNRILPRRCKVFPHQEVTRTNPEEVDPREVGMTREQVDRIWKSVVSYYKTGLQPGMSLCIRRKGRILLDRAIGHARGNSPGALRPKGLVQATPETWFNLFSASKSVTAMLIHLLLERKQLRLEERVAEYLPDFARKGKGDVTVRHLLSHKAGIARPPSSKVLDPATLKKPGAILNAIYDMELQHEPGTVLAYHAVTTGFILEAILEEVTGQGINQFLDTEIRKPLGFTTLTYGVEDHQVDQIAESALTGPKAHFPFRQILMRSLGVELDRCIEISNDPDFLTTPVPSGNVIATANEVSRFYELLLRGGTLDGVKIFEPETIARAVRVECSGEIDRIIMLPIPYSLGFMLSTDPVGLYGFRAPRAFGHLGFTNVLGWGDPERDISVGFMNNGKPFVTPELLIWLNIVRTVAQQTPRDCID
jgi:CubicO group peptidase (beta-lactamase class C family)